MPWDAIALRNRRMALAMSVGLAISPAPAVAADDDPICAARPGKATPACTLAAGQLQIETGLADWSLQRGDGERTTSLVLGESVLRIGVTDRTEVQFDVTPWIRATDTEGGAHHHASGIGDLNVALKHRLTSDEAAVQMALVPVVTIPTAKHSLGSGKLVAALLAPIGFSISKSAFSVNLTPELDWTADGDGHGHHAATAQVASFAWVASDKLTLSGELWGQWDWDPAGTSRQASADAAVAYLVDQNLQLDGGANFGLNKATPDIELYAGVSKRF